MPLDAVAVLTFESPDVLMSTLTFSNVTGGGVLNQTDFFCVSADDPNIRNVERVILAGRGITSSHIHEDMQHIAYVHVMFVYVIAI